MNIQIPIIALTADVTTADLKKCKAVGMNDYISKPLDEKLLYSKMLDFLKKTKPLKATITSREISKITDLTYLNKRTKANPELMMEMIGLYLKQTPPMIIKMKQSLLVEDWNSVYEAAHKLIPSFSIMGINKDFETAAKKIQEYSGTQKNLDKIQELVLLIESVCTQACEELEEELKMIKNPK